MSETLHRLSRNPIAVISGVVVVAYLTLALLCACGVAFPSFAETDQSHAYQPPDAGHLLGTDIFGRDVLARAAHGTTTSLTVGFFGAGIAVLIGTGIGALAGFFGGRVDSLVIWLYTTFDSVPYILLLAAFTLKAGPGLGTLCLALGLTGWTNHCRIVRSEVIKHRGREYVQSAAALGAGPLRQIFAHILPNIFHLVLIDFALFFVLAIKSEVVLSYLGLGVRVGTPSWGMMMSDARVEIGRDVWWGLAAATGFMFFLVLAVSLFTSALRDALDPKLRT